MKIDEMLLYKLIPKFEKFSDFHGIINIEVLFLIGSYMFYRNYNIIHVSIIGVVGENKLFSIDYLYAIA